VGCAGDNVAVPNDGLLATLATGDANLNEDAPRSVPASMVRGRSSGNHVSCCGVVPSSELLINRCMPTNMVLCTDTRQTGKCST
jgi:hypothetical protein